MSTDLVTLPAGTPLRPGVVRLEIVTPTGTAVRVDVDSVEAPSVNGEFGVLPGHLPLLAALRAGVVTYRTAGRSVVVAVGPGFAEALPDRMSVLTDRCMDAHDVDLAAVRGELESAQRRLDAFQGLQEGQEYEELARARDWVQAQIDAAKAIGRS